MLQCNISSTTNEMTTGILETLTQQIEKHSEHLGRTALYTEQSRIARLPMYLSVHFVRFYWRRDINKYVAATHAEKPRSCARSSSRSSWTRACLRPTT